MKELNMSKQMMRPEFEHLNTNERVMIMQILAEKYNMLFRELYTFNRWGQKSTTGIFEKNGKEFVFVPGDTVTLGWENFVTGLDKENEDEMKWVLEEFEYEGSYENFIRECMAPARQVTILPMLAGRRLEEIGWEAIQFDDIRLTSHPEWLEDFRKFSVHGNKCLNIVGKVRFNNIGNNWKAYLYHETDYVSFKQILKEKGFSLPTSDEWSYLSGGGCRTLFPWGDGIDYKMHLKYFNKSKKQSHYDMEKPNFFGLSIAFDPYKREVVEADVLTTCGGDGGCNICGGMGALLGFMPCSPHYKPEENENNILDGDFDFYRPIIRVELNN